MLGPSQPIAISLSISSTRNAFYLSLSISIHLYISRSISIYPVQRAAGLQRYCNELLCNPAALGCSGVAGFFELDTVWLANTLTLTLTVRRASGVAPYPYPYPCPCP